MSRIEGIQTLVRPYVTVLFAATLCYGFVVGKIGAEAFLSVVSVVITFWFSQRGDKEKQQPPPGGAS